MPIRLGYEQDIFFAVEPSQYDGVFSEDRLKHLLAQTASFLSKTLLIRVAGFEDATFLELLHLFIDEGHRARQNMAIGKYLHRMFCFVVAMEDMCDKMLFQLNGEESIYVDVAWILNCSVYYQQRDIDLSPLGVPNSYTLGNIGQELYVEHVAVLMDHLVALDAALCAAMNAMKEEDDPIEMVPPLQDAFLHIAEALSYTICNESTPNATPSLKTSNWMSAIWFMYMDDTHQSATGQLYALRASTSQFLHPEQVEACIHLPQIGDVEYFAYLDSAVDGVVDVDAQRLHMVMCVVQQYVTDGLLRRGSINREIGLRLSHKQKWLSRMAAHSIELARRPLALAIKVPYALRSMLVEEEHRIQIRNAADALSPFSTAEIMMAFDPGGPIYRTIRRSLASETRPLIPESQQPSALWETFASDAMQLLLHFIEIQRNEVRRNIYTSGEQSLQSLLMRIDSIRSWHPTDGALRLRENDVLLQAPHVVDVLKQLSGRSELVQWKCRKGRKRGVFVFNSLQLYKLIQV